MNQTINIVKLIEENPNTKLSNSYQGKLINKLKDNFSTEEQQLFISSFYCYLNYKSNDFVIDLDHIWKWLGFSTKQKAKDLLKDNFKLDFDYKTVFNLEVKNSKGGRPSDKFMMNIKTFKKMCLKANTSKANDIHEYYIKLEETLHELIDEESNELRLQLEEKEAIIELQEEENIKQFNRVKLLEKKNMKKSERTVYGTNCVYIITNKYLIQDRTYIVGKAISLTERLSQYNKMAEHDVVHYVECNNAEQMSLIEKSILYKLNNYRERADRDRFILPEDKDISFFSNILNEACNWFKDVGEDVIIESMYDEKEYYEDNKEYIREYKKQHYDENKEEITIKNKEWYENNKEKVKIYNQEYREENKEKINEQKKIYKKEHIEEYKERDAKYYAENKDQIQTKQKVYQEENKDKILKQRKEYYNKNIEEIRAKDRARNPKVTCECGLLICKRSLPAHRRSKTHESFLTKINSSGILSPENDKVEEV